MCYSRRFNKCGMWILSISRWRLVRRSVAEFGVMLEDDELAHGHLAAGGGVIVFKHVQNRLPEKLQILL